MRTTGNEPSAIGALWSAGVPLNTALSPMTTGVPPDPAGYHIITGTGSARSGAAIDMLRTPTWPAASARWIEIAPSTTAKRRAGNNLMGLTCNGRLHPSNCDPCHVTWSIPPLLNPHPFWRPALALQAAERRYRAPTDKSPIG